MSLDGVCVSSSDPHITLGLNLIVEFSRPDEAEKVVREHGDSLTSFDRQTSTGNVFVEGEIEYRDECPTFVTFPDKVTEYRRDARIKSVSWIVWAQKQ